MRLFRGLSSRFVVIALVGVIAVALAGIAIAAWVVSGSGTGYAKAGSSSALTLSDASASTSADLYPGAAGAVKLKSRTRIPSRYASRLLPATVR